MSRTKAPSNLPDLVKTVFEKAREHGDLLWFPTQVAILSARGAPFQLRFAATLANKPRPPAEDPNQPKKPLNPFEHPPEALTVASIGETHRLVLNKFPCVKGHAILATNTFKPQNDLLEADDLAATYSCVNAYHDAGKELFVFFNSGEHSGASQPHRHVQFMPVEHMRDGLDACEDGDKWEIVANKLVGAAPGGVTLPFTTFAEHLRPDMSPRTLRDIYLRLYRQACAALNINDGGSTDGPAKISYNMAMTQDAIVICPRTAEGSALHSADGFEAVGKLSLNGTVLGGTALVKNEAEWNALRGDKDQLAEVLSKIGVPTSSVGGQ